MDEGEIELEIGRFKHWLRENALLREGSMQVYGRVIKHFYGTNKIMSTKRIIEYIVNQNKKSNETHTRAAFIKYFSFKGVDEQYRKKNPTPGSWENYLKYTLPVPKRMPRKRKPGYVPDHILKRLISNIADPVYRDISVLRYYTGIRISEALTIRGEHIDKEPMQDSASGKQIKYVKITITKKGGGKRIIGITMEIAKRVFKKYKITAGFIFIPKEISVLQANNEAKFWKRIQSYVRYYNEALNDARLKIGLEGRFASHDIRRNFAERMRKDEKSDIFEIKGMLGHRDIRTTVRYFNESEEESVKNMIKYQGGFDERNEESIRKKKTPTA